MSTYINKNQFVNTYINANLILFFVGYNNTSILYAEKEIFFLREKFCINLTSKHGLHWIEMRQMLNECKCGNVRFDHWSKT